MMKFLLIQVVLLFLPLCSCQNSGWTSVVFGCIRGNNDWAGTVTDIEACLKRCEDETSFTCLSIDYKDGSCHLSRFNHHTVVPADFYTSPCYNSGWFYCERRLRSTDGKWTDKSEACIRNHNDWMGDASSYIACQISCEEQSSFTCLSIDYKEGRCQHSRFNRQSIRPISDFTQPCYNGQTWYYAERLDIEYAWTDIVYGCIRSNNDWEGSVTDVEACQKRCEDETSFVCLSIDYKNGSCHLSRFNRDSIRPTDYYTQHCYISGWHYSERRDIKYLWTETVEGCIRNNNDWNGRTSSLANCQKKCLDERDFTCLSVDYLNGICHLSRFHRNTIQPTSDYTQPCYVPEWYYAERINMGQWTPVVSACIRAHNIRSITVPNIDSCLLICSQEDRCCSIDYNEGHCNLSPNNRANVNPSYDYTEPCYVSGYQYSERVDVFCSSH